MLGFDLSHEFKDAVDEFANQTFLLGTPDTGKFELKFHKPMQNVYSTTNGATHIVPCVITARNGSTKEELAQFAENLNDKLGQHVSVSLCAVDDSLHGFLNLSYQEDQNSTTFLKKITESYQRDIEIFHSLLW